MKKIILCTTFRDFSGTLNDDIQRLFLQSIAAQTYKSFELVITLFGEKNVERELEKYNLHTFFYNHEIGNYRYTLTAVLNNAIEYGIDTGDDFILLWTTCDVIYDDNFFQEIIDASREYMVGTSHPHVTYHCLEDCVNSKNEISGDLFSGFDLMFFDSEFFDQETRKILQSYNFYDWGVFEHFLISLPELKMRSGRQIGLLNIYETAKIRKIENNRALTDEPSVFLAKSHERNSIIFDKFLNDYKLSRQYFDLTYCHLKFSNSKRNIAHVWSFKSDIFKFIKRTIKFHISKIMRMVINKDLRGGK